MLPPGALQFPKGGGGGGDYNGTKIIKFPNTTKYFVQMILNNLQKTKKKQPKTIKRSPEKILILVPTSAKRNGTYVHKRVTMAIFQKMRDF